MAEIKRLYRSRQNRILAGVCGGIADYFKIDPLIIRLFFVFSFFLNGAGILAYIIGWIIIPERPYDYNGEQYNEKFDEESYYENESSGFNRTNQRFIGIILIIIGAFIIFSRVIPLIVWRNFWAIILIVLGISILVKGVSGSD
ncbi:PspC domain-containing protein [Halanaerobiaceae bacterium Z-7014]|uniref:PspC domain-containing protein n=1 Tax=Halonatronomonas betaini TaxID=2778430 RepID=A0A931AQT1_9FIRM|nr:PspC domain-containing protein [Halonatronomonas betaini]MBF8437242.1 PspC domain-containing protein [Halonatronomonas betaini]